MLLLLLPMPLTLLTLFMLLLCMLKKAARVRASACAGENGLPVIPPTRKKAAHAHTSVVWGGAVAYKRATRFRSSLSAACG